MSNDPLDFLTVLKTNGPLATKRITYSPDGPKIEGYGQAKWFGTQEWGVSGIDTLASVLTTLEHADTSFIIRGHPMPWVDYRRAQRRVRDRHNPDGTVTPATIEPVCRHWIALDCDRLGCPDWLDPAFEPDQTVEFVVSHLPIGFHDATCWWQFTASQGIKSGISLRLFFWSDRPLDDWELKVWLEDSPVDQTIFSAAQPIYVARPIFVGGPDPVPFRSGVWRGDRDAVIPPMIERRASQSTGATASFNGDRGTGYAYHRARIGDHDAGGGFHGPVMSAIGAWLANHGTAVETGWLRADLEHAIRSARRDPAKHGDDYIEFRVADLDPAIASIVESQAAQEAAAAVVEPSYPAPTHSSVEEARAALVAGFERILAETLAYNDAAMLGMAA